MGLPQGSVIASSVSSIYTNDSYKVMGYSINDPVPNYTILHTHTHTHTDMLGCFVGFLECTECNLTESTSIFIIVDAAYFISSALEHI